MKKKAHIYEFSSSRLFKVKLCFRLFNMLVFTKHVHKYDAFDLTTKVF